MSLADRLPYEWQIGWRYTRAGRAGRRNGFISFISAVSTLGIALGVAALIIVLSVMNGFQQEVRQRLLSVVAHVEIVAADGGAVADWQAAAALAQQDGRVQAAAPFVAAQALLSRDDAMRGVRVRGIDPALEAGVTDLARRVGGHELATLAAGRWHVVLGVELARQLGVRVGDKVSLVAPSGQVTPAGIVPRQRSFTVSGVFASGHFDYDAGWALVHIDDASRLFRTEGPTGVQLRLADVHDARAAASALQARLPPALQARDWTRTHRSWFDAVQVEKRMMFIILALVVAVAAFNLVSTLVMTVDDKRSDIAILRTLGATPPSVMGIFVVQGATAGVIGTVAGLVGGLAVALHIDVIVPAIERALGVAFLPGSVYATTRMPSEPMASDVLPVAVIALVLAFAATLYPSWRASRIDPADALRHE